MSRWPDPGAQLERALVRSAADAGIVLALVARAATPWASVTFAGARHRLTLAAFPSQLLDRWLAELPDAEFALRGHLVADLALVSRVQSGEPAEIVLEILTVEDC